MPRLFFEASILNHPIVAKSPKVDIVNDFVKNVRFSRIKFLLKNPYRQHACVANFSLTQKLKKEHIPQKTFLIINQSFLF